MKGMPLLYLEYTIQWDSAGGFDTCALHLINAASFAMYISIWREGALLIQDYVAAKERKWLYTLQKSWSGRTPLYMQVRKSRASGLIEKKHLLTIQKIYKYAAQQKNTVQEPLLWAQDKASDVSEALPSFSVRASSFSFETIKKPSNTIDLHLEGQVQPDALRRQMALLETFFFECLKWGISPVKIIHGKGRGILREEVHRFLDAYADYVAHSALSWDGGYTEVHFHPPAGGYRPFERAFCDV